MNESVAALQVAPPAQPVALFTETDAFELALRKAKVYSASTLVPMQYQNNLPNCLIAMNMARRIGADELQVMQNLYIVQGKPGWSAQFLIATFNQCGKFSPIRFEWQGKQGEKDWGCRAYATEKATGEKIIGAWVTWKMAEAEGWSKKNGSKWQTMPEQMFSYRAAAFLVRAFAPEIAMGLQTVEELRDTEPIDVTPAPTKTAAVTEALAAKLQPQLSDPIGKALGPHVAVPLPGKAKRAEKPIPPADQSVAPPLTYAIVADRINKASDEQLLEVAAEFIPAVADLEQQAELARMVEARQAELRG